MVDAAADDVVDEGRRMWQRIGWLEQGRPVSMSRIMYGMVS
jgi:hypothetical protein